MTSEPDPALTSAFEKAYKLTKTEAQNRVILEKGAGELNRFLKEKLGSRYAGMWFDNSDGRIKVGVASGTDDAAVRSIIASQGLQASTDLVPVRSTWVELVNAQGTVNTNLRGLLAESKVQTGIAASTNAIVINISPNATAADRERVIGLSNDLNNVKIEPRYPPAKQFEIGADECITTPTGSGLDAMCDRPIRGATLIYHEDGDDVRTLCSAGFLMRREEGDETHTWLMTAGHCVALSGGSNEPWYMCNSKEECHEIGLSGGYVYGEDYPNPGGTRDSAAIAINPESYWASSMYPESYAFTYSTQYYTEGIGESYEGLGLCHLGISTPNDGSGSNCGNVQALDVTVKYTGGNVLNDMTEVTACGHHGDSGGPFYADNIAYGQMSGADECPQGGGFNSGVSFFDEALDIEYEMGLDIWVV